MRTERRAQNDDIQGWPESTERRIWRVHEPALHG